MHNEELNFVCTFRDRNVDRVLFDKIHECVNHSVCDNIMWIYYPTMYECNRVIHCCVDRLTELSELSESNIDLENKLEMEWLSRVVLRAFVNIQKALLAQNK